jgi:NAD(P)-dependent dehydrogenase (short-subunit alcohol dehydrogenase family)
MLVDMDEDALKEAADELGSDKLSYAVANITNAREVEAYAEKTRKEMGKVDVFFNNAGIEGKVQPIVDYPIDEFDKVMNVNVRGAWLGMKYMIPLMREGGSIIISSSVAGLRGTANVSAYVSSKHALVGLMRTAALELAPQKIRVNTINPSPVDNRMMRSLESGFDPEGGDKVKSQFEQMIPLGRYASNDDIAQLVTFLASNESSFITGAVHPVDGGMTAS